MNYGQITNIINNKGYTNAMNYSNQLDYIIDANEVKNIHNESNIDIIDTTIIAIATPLRGLFIVNIIIINIKSAIHKYVL